MKLLVPAMLCFVLVSGAGAATLLSRGGDTVFLAGEGGYTTFVLSWTQDKPTTNTTIQAFDLRLVNGPEEQPLPLALLFDLYASASFNPALGEDWQGSIMFENPVNTATSEITVTSTPFTANVFENLDLAMGTYYLVGVVAGQGEWRGGPDVSAEPGFAFGRFFASADDETFQEFTDGPSVHISGDVVDGGSQIPEPATMVITGAGFVLLAFAARRRRA